MRTVKLNAIGHQWVGEFEKKYRFKIKYRPGRTNMDADTLSLMALDIDKYVAEFTEELLQDVVEATWESPEDNISLADTVCSYINFCDQICLPSRTFINTIITSPDSLKLSECATKKGGHILQRSIHDTCSLGRQNLKKAIR